jgi:hypothetical protein
MRITIKQASKLIQSNIDHIKLLASEGYITREGSWIDGRTLEDYMRQKIRHDMVRDYHGF